jgi:hypothetical protein
MSKRKQCTKCSKKFPATAKFFCRRRERKSGFSSQCKVCEAGRKAAWYATNPDKARSQHAAYYAANRKKVLRRTTAWQAANREKCCAATAKWRAANPNYDPWLSMIHRCTNRKHESWEFYGAIGVRVCSRWSDPEHGYDNFMADMGPKPTPQHSLGRFGDVGDYELGNCAWQTWPEQRAEARKKRELLQKAA